MPELVDELDDAILIQAIGTSIDVGVGLDDAGDQGSDDGDLIQGGQIVRLSFARFFSYWGM